MQGHIIMMFSDFLFTRGRPPLLAPHFKKRENCYFPKGKRISVLIFHINASVCKFMFPLESLFLYANHVALTNTNDGYLTGLTHSFIYSISIYQTSSICETLCQMLLETQKWIKSRFSPQAIYRFLRGRSHNLKKIQYNIEIEMYNERDKWHPMEIQRRRDQVQLKVPDSFLEEVALSYPEE